MTNPLRHILILCILFFSATMPAQKETASKTPDIEKFTEAFEKQDGFLPFYWDDNSGKIYLEINNLNSEFLYVNSLAAGIGSNDIGLDRGQLGQERIVKFIKSGPKILLVQPNPRYRALSDNPYEKRAVEEAFAQSVLGGFTCVAQTDDRWLIDMTPFLIRDAHGVIQRLKDKKQGNYKLDKTMSAIYLERTMAFPKNVEFEALLTFTGQAEGGWIRSVTPTPDHVTVRQHHSFIELPDDKYNPRVFDPRSGFNNIAYFDYAQPINKPLVQRYITRHRLEKANPKASLSAPVEPIVYYLDPGTPEPVRSALLEGASWWNQAFTAAGYKDGFQVKMLPEGADPLDVRYNVIQWVHRSTRGWSYGASVTDPRTGEIIKGHVSLGSLRVRQDYLIAQGLKAVFDGEDDDTPLVKMALARLRQLSAHEVGHTLGLAHNFAASTNERSSVMDYPHPLVTVGDKGLVSFDNAYDDKIGAWDKRTIRYGYGTAGKDQTEEEYLTDELKQSDAMNFRYISDRDARPESGAHPHAHLWDNGPDPVAELTRLSTLRSVSLGNLGLNSIPGKTPRAYLHNILVPVYLMHRYQVEAVAKLIGGYDYSYAHKEYDPSENAPVDLAIQRQAVDGLLRTLNPGFLKLPSPLLDLIPPQPKGYNDSRELFDSRLDMVFDPLTAAAASAGHTLNFMLTPERLNRLYVQNAVHGMAYTVDDYVDQVWSALSVTSAGDNYALALNEQSQELYVHQIISVLKDQKTFPAVAAVLLHHLKDIQSAASLLDLENGSSFGGYLAREIQLFISQPAEYNLPYRTSMPPGSPIGCGSAF